MRSFDPQPDPRRLSEKDVHHASRLRGRRCESRSAVNRTSEWPSSFDTSTSSTPAAIRRLAAPCRRSWKRSFRIAGSVQPGRLAEPEASSPSGWPCWCGCDGTSGAAGRDPGTLPSITLAVRTRMKEWRARRQAPAALHVVAVWSSWPARTPAAGMRTTETTVRQSHSHPGSRVVISSSYGRTDNAAERQGTRDAEDHV